MNPGDADDDPPSPETPRGKFPAWAKGPIFMYLTMVAAFAVAGVFVLYYVLRLK